MGCDIHAVIEYNCWGTFWDSFGDIDIPRDYTLFSAIAFGDGGIVDELPYPPRGLPPDVSLKTDSLVYMDAQAYRDLMAKHGRDPVITSDLMEDWEREKYQLTGAILAPDFHTWSWLSFSEFEVALEQGGITIEKQSPEIKAMLSAMRILADHYGAEKVRIVFWFNG